MLLSTLRLIASGIYLHICISTVIQLMVRILLGTYLIIIYLLEDRLLKGYAIY